MKIRDIKIEIKPYESFKKESLEFAKNLSKGKRVKPLVGLGFHSVEDFRNFFTPRRVEILKTIRNKEPKSIYSLAKILKRDIKSVTVDLNILEENGLIELRKNKRSVVPFHDYDKLRIEMEL